MPTEPVRSHRNQRVVKAARLHRARARRGEGMTLIEGPHLLDEALQAGIVPRQVFALENDTRSFAVAKEHGLDLVLVDDRALRRLSGTETPRGPVAVIDIPEPPVSELPGLVVSWGVSDPGNVGTMIRTAAAFGWGFAFTSGTADPWSPKVLRSGAGAQFRVGCRVISSLAEITEMGYVTVASVVAGGVPPSTLEGGRYALLVGEEAAGLPPEVTSSADLTVTIPMPGGSESLNAAMAAAIVVYELSKPGEEGTARV